MDKCNQNETPLGVLDGVVSAISVPRVFFFSVFFPLFVFFSYASFVFALDREIEREGARGPLGLLSWLAALCTRRSRGESAFFGSLGG